MSKRMAFVAFVCKHKVGPDPAWKPVTIVLVLALISLVLVVLVLVLVLVVV